MQAPAIPATLGEAEALLKDQSHPGFAEPWQAEAFACALHLSRQGVFSWSEWVEVFSAEIKASPQRPDETSDAAYYRQWLAALETILARKGATNRAEIDARQEAWRKAYLATPHGHPVELANADCPPPRAGHHHHHHHHAHAEDGDDHDHPPRRERPKPVSVSPAKK